MAYKHSKYLNEFSGGTIYSGSTDLSLLFGGPRSPFSGNSIYGSIMAISGGSTAIGNNSFAQGVATIASGNYGSHSEGYQTLASGDIAHAEGRKSTASSTASHAEGGLTTASGAYSHSEGGLSIASGDFSHAQGFSTTASGGYTHAEGRNTIASGSYSHAEGYNNTAVGESSHAEGKGNVSSSLASHAEGYYTVASGEYSHTEGQGTFATNYGTHAEGQRTTAGGYTSHAEGLFSKALGYVSHAEGDHSLASGGRSHSEGFYTTASGGNSHAGGAISIAFGTNSFVHSSGSTSNSNESAILGGSGNTLTTNAVRSVILGGKNIIGTEADTVYGVNFKASGSISATTFYSGSTNLEELISNLNSISLLKNVTAGDSLTATTLNHVLAINIASGVTFSLPINPKKGQSFIIKDASGNAVINNITINVVGGAHLIDGSTQEMLENNYESARYIFNGTQYLNI